jgi:hypothetical protein
VNPGGVDDPEYRTLLAFVAVFAPASAATLLSRVDGPDAEALRARGVRLASQPRRARLLALAEALEEARSRRGARRAPPALEERACTREAVERWLGGAGEASSVPSRALRRLLEERASVGQGRSAATRSSGARERRR